MCVHDFYFIQVIPPDALYSTPLQYCLTTKQFLYIESDKFQIIWNLSFTKRKHIKLILVWCSLFYKTYIKENCVAIGISITTIDTIKSLGKLHIAQFSSKYWIHQKAHCFPNSLAIVHIMITIKIENKGSICENCRHPHLYKCK